MTMTPATIWALVAIAALAVTAVALALLAAHWHRQYRGALDDLADATHEATALAHDLDLANREVDARVEQLAKAHEVNARWTLRFDERVTKEAAHLCGAIANGIWAKGDPGAPADHTPAAVIEAGQALVERDRDVRRALYVQEHPEYAAGITAEPAP